MANFSISDTQPQPIALGSAWVNLFPVCVAAGFPSPAEDHLVQRIDLMAQLIQHLQATFMLRVRGESMRDAGIFEGDVVLVDRAINPHSGHVVIAAIKQFKT
jgi:DNA polymerase V